MRAAPRDAVVPDARLAGAYITVGLVALFGGMVTGLLQALTLAGVDIPAHFLVQSYYHSVSLHGVLNVLVWTTFFICGFVPFLASRALATPLHHRRSGWAAFWVMIGGPRPGRDPPRGQRRHRHVHLLSAAQGAVGLLRGPHPGRRRHVAGDPQPHPHLAALAGRASRRAARPLAAFMSLITFAMWTIASLGLAAEMLFLLIPWSLGLVAGRPTRCSPVRCSGSPGTRSSTSGCCPPTSPGTRWCRARRAASSSAIRWPGPRSSCSSCSRRRSGFHHQYTDPGIHQGWKLVHAFLTFAVFFPSLLTFFNVTASLESGARARGGKGWVAWFGKLPWGDPSLAAQVLAMLLFTFGGIGGLINASYNLNLVVHNTAWIPGHLHLTVGTAVTLTLHGHHVLAPAHGCAVGLSGAGAWPSRRCGCGSAAWRSSPTPFTGSACWARRAGRC